MKIFALSICILLSLGCDSDEGTNNGPIGNNGNTNNTNNLTNNGTVKNNGSIADCMPSKAQWDATVKVRMENNCGSCHGDVPSFGAPYGLLDYDAIMAGQPGERIVDKIGPSTADFSMPPNGTSVTHQDRDTITEWASCGNIHPDHSIGLSSNRTPHVAGPKPENLTEYSYTVDNVEVTPDTLDAYACYTFAAPDKGFISRIEAIIDESRVLHHLVVFRTDRPAGERFDGIGCSATNGETYYAWAPGGGALQFPENGGATIAENETFLLQIHYNNGAGLENIVDNSGFKIFVADEVEDEYRMMALGSGVYSIGVPPGEEFEASRTCVVNKDLTTFIGFPHMHEIGHEFHETIIRANQEEESLIDITGWSFENQPFYDYNIDLKPGDKIKTTCVFKNTTDKLVRGGFRTQDEMCFDFIFITPADADCVK